ncbi:hypothetical protein DQF84_25585 [Escherichia coli]|nr:hypothetical protein [Escherichia coli]EGD7263234.1 hypothetical protein [Escherichia coli]EGE0765240.1 hypothetical protein [Escherichia coli]
MFFLMLFFCGYRACYCSSSFSSSSSFRSSPVYGFSGRPPGGAACRERSQRSCLRPGGLLSLTRNPSLQRPFRSRRLCRAVALLIACRVPHTRMSPCRRGLIQPQPAALTVQGK